MLVKMAGSFEALEIPSDVCEAVVSDGTDGADDVAGHVELADRGDGGDESESKGDGVSNSDESSGRCPFDKPEKGAVSDFESARVDLLREVVSYEKILHYFVGGVFTREQGCETYLDQGWGGIGAKGFARSPTYRATIAGLIRL